MPPADGRRSVLRTGRPVARPWLVRNTRRRTTPAPGPRRITRRTAWPRRTATDRPWTVGSDVAVTAWTAGLDWVGRTGIRNGTCWMIVVPPVGDGVLPEPAAASGNVTVNAAGELSLPAGSTAIARTVVVSAIVIGDPYARQPAAGPLA